MGFKIKKRQRKWIIPIECDTIAEAKQLLSDIEEEDKDFERYEENAYMIYDVESGKECTI